MSTLYNLEPQPTAKAILHTTSGDISLELFAQQTPSTSRNFLQLCLDGYYDNTLFHRLVPGFILQGGDPTGTGSGGASSFDNGLPFQDEFHSRLKFNRRGLLGMANGGGKDDNASQFFLTLGKTEELNGRNTMFGRVEAGNTIFNLVKMGEADLTEEGGERPLYPTMITGMEVLVNPFADMVKRVRTATAAAGSSREPVVKRKPAVKKKAAKTLLSFGGEEGEDIATPAIKPAKFNPKLVSAAESQSTFTSAPQERAPKRRLSRSVSPPRKPSPHTTAPAPPQRRPSPSPTPSRSLSPPRQHSTTSAQALESTLASIAQLKSSLKRSVPTASHNNDKPKSALEAMIPTTATRGRKRKAGADTQGRDEQKALDAFKAFGRKLDEVSAVGGGGAFPSSSAAAAAAQVNGRNGSGAGRRGVGDGDGDGEGGSYSNGVSTFDDDNDDDEEAHLCDLHFIVNCQSCTDWEKKKKKKTTKSVLSGPPASNDAPHDSLDGDGDGGGGGSADDDDDDDDAREDESIFTHRLTFAKDRLGKDLAWKRANESDLVVIDPREKEREIVGDLKGRAREKERGKGRSVVRR